MDCPVGRTPLGICPPHPVNRTVFKESIRRKRALVILVSAGRLGELRDCLERAFRFFNDAFRYPVFLFHDNLDEAHAVGFLNQRLSTKQTSLLLFCRIQFHLPPGFDADAALKKGVVDRERWPNYHHMCAFWWKHVFAHPAVRRLEYYLRLDSDSIIYGPIQYDIFDYFHRHAYQYGYRIWMLEGANMITGLWDFYVKYLNRHGIPQSPYFHIPTPEDSDHGMPLYYNNFEIVHVPTFSFRRDIRRFVDEVYNEFGIYTYRWGDAPLRFLLVNTFLDVPRRVHNCCDVLYMHQGHRRPVCTIDPSK